MRAKATSEEARPVIVIEPTEDKAFSEFLNSQSPKTRRTYTTLLRHVKEFSGQTGAEMLRTHKQWERKILEYKNRLEQKDTQTILRVQQLAAYGDFSSTIENHSV